MENREQYRFIGTSDQVPGPSGFPILGNTLDFTQDPPAFLTRMQRTFGDIVHFRMNLGDYYLLSDPKDIRNFLVRDYENFDKTGMYVKMRKLMGNGLLTCPFAQHKRQKRILLPAFSSSSLQHYGAVMPKVIYENGRMFKEGQSFDLTAAMDSLTLSVAARILLGDELCEDPRIRENVDALIEEFTPRAMAIYFFWPKWLPLPQNSRLAKIRRSFEAITDVVIEKGRKNGFSSKNLVSVMAKSMIDDAEPSPDVLREMTDQMITLLLAGHDTTATTLTWIWTLISQHPEVEKRFHAELDDVLDGRLPTIENLPQLTYTEMIMKEAMRLHPVAWAINRKAIRDYKVGGFTIPAGSNVSVSPFVTHRDPRFYKDPLKFDPDRWTPEEEAKRPEHSFFPFSAGGRGCIGEGFATMEIKFVMAILGKMWRFQILPGQNFECMPRVTLRPKNHVMARLVRHLEPVPHTLQSLDPKPVAA